MDKNNTVDYLENAKNRIDKEASKLLVESTIYHESTHYGNLKVNNNPNGVYSESGKEFENRAYGIDLSYRNHKNYYQLNFNLPKIATRYYGTIY